MSFHSFENLSDFMLLQVGHSEKGIMREAGQLTNASSGLQKASQIMRSKIMRPFLHPLMLALYAKNGIIQYVCSYIQGKN